MKTLITSTGPETEARMDPRFGRAAFFCLYDHQTGDIAFIQNEFRDAQGGAGTKVAEKVLQMNAGRVISGDFGPKAKELLDKFEIQLVKYNDDQKTIAEIIDSIK
ncbi:MAG: NifB/NifX family molybdenum-iron cluster-binding protein [Bacteroidota bacterium]